MEEFTGLRVEQRHVREENMTGAERRGVLGAPSRTRGAEERGLKSEAAPGVCVEVTGDIPPLDFEVGVVTVVAGEGEAVAGLRDGKTLGGGERDLCAQRGEEAVRAECAEEQGEEEARDV